MIEKNKDSQNQSLSELQQELKSLKALLLSRGPAAASAAPSPTLNFGRPSIPAWQLASPTPTPSINTLESVVPAAPASSGASGKGKEPEREPELMNSPSSS
jgi:peroxin-14